MNEVEKKVLYKFVELHRVHPYGDVLFLWVQAGGKVASQQSVQRTCPECGGAIVEGIPSHCSQCMFAVPASR